MPIKFSDDLDVNEFTQHSRSILDDLFWEDDELAEFRHKAFLIDCGLETESFGEESSFEGSLDESIDSMGNDELGKDQMDTFVRQMHSSLPVINEDFEQLIETKKTVQRKQKQERIQRASRKSPKKSPVRVPKEIRLGTTHTSTHTIHEEDEETLHDDLERSEATLESLPLPPFLVDEEILATPRTKLSTSSITLSSSSPLTPADAAKKSKSSLTSSIKARPYLMGQRASFSGRISSPRTPETEGRRSLIMDKLDLWSPKDSEDLQLSSHSSPEIPTRKIKRKKKKSKTAKSKSMLVDGVMQEKRKAKSKNSTKKKERSQSLNDLVPPLAVESDLKKKKRKSKKTAAVRTEYDSDLDSSLADDDRSKPVSLSAIDLPSTNNSKNGKKMSRKRAEKSRDGFVPKTTTSRTKSKSTESNTSASTVTTVPFDGEEELASSTTRKKSPRTRRKGSSSRALNDSETPPKCIATFPDAAGRRAKLQRSQSVKLRRHRKKELLID